MPKIQAIYNASTGKLSYFVQTDPEGEYLSEEQMAQFKRDALAATKEAPAEVYMFTKKQVHTALLTVVDAQGNNL